MYAKVLSKKGRVGTAIQQVESSFSGLNNNFLAQACVCSSVHYKYMFGIYNLLEKAKVDKVKAKGSKTEKDGIIVG